MKKIVLFALLLIVFACKSNKKDKQNLLFEQVAATQTGVDFENKLTETNDWNIIQYLYFYNGGGVAVGDINGDNLPDIYFTSNQGANKLYLNKGNFKFEDITEKAGVADTEGWKTGVTMADVNGDGKLDIYVSHVSAYKGLAGKNRLFINNGTPSPTFTDQAERLGLATLGLCTQAAFFDYDGDGDLDCYVLRHSVHSAKSYRPVSARAEKDEMSGDIFYKNYGGRFEDESEKAGIRDGSLGYGLGISIGDLNGDGLPDIYVGNDFHDNDYLYWNNGNGTFTEGVNAAMSHNSNFSMGNDVADFNNDGKLDFIGVDMKPEEETILKASGGIESYNLFDYKNKEYGFNFQFPKNSLQLNRGNFNGKTANFSEIAQFSGVSTTDWSWSSLFADFDNDGLKDLYITNGIMRRPNDLDYIKYLSNDEVQKRASDLDLAKQMPDGKATNYCYHNKGDLTFENVSENWGLDQYGLSNGAAYADLDNDGDLDLIVNNVNEKAFVLKNKSEIFYKNKYLTIKLLGKGSNTEGVGAKVIAYAQDVMQMQEQSPTRGFESSVDSRLHFGFSKGVKDEISVVDSLRIVWRDGSTQLLKNVNLNQQLTINQKNAAGKWDFKKEFIAPNPFAQKSNLDSFSRQNIVFQSVTDKLNIKFKHKENAFYDTDKEKLLPHFLSTEGPKLAVGDVNGDGLEDFYVGGAKKQAGQIFTQTKDGSFSILKNLDFEKSAESEDVGAAFFDADGDKDLDLYVVSGGNEATEGSEEGRDRLYLNDGKGNFKRREEALPKFFHNGSCVKPCDFDGDGDVDIFVGSRSDLREYGLNPKSFLLKNDGKGNFSEIPSIQTGKTLTPFAEGLDSIGMVTDAVWTDLNSDNRPDLVVVGEWMPITIFYNRGDYLEKNEIENTSGWWNCITAADVNKDGHPDLFAGNMGLNSNWQASPARPMSLHVKDFDGNGDREPIVSYFRQGLEWCYNSKDELTAQIPSLRKRFPDYAPFAKSSFEKVFTKEMLKNSVKKHVQRFASVYLENRGNGDLELKNLPTDAQLSTTESILIEDFDNDGNLDIALGGNFYEMQPSISRFDASFGSVLRGDGKGNFRTINPLETGWILRGAVRDIKKIGNWIIVAANNENVQVFEIKKTKKEEKKEDKKEEKTKAKK